MGTGAVLKIKKNMMMKTTSKKEEEKRNKRIMVNRRREERRRSPHTSMGHRGHSFLWSQAVMRHTAPEVSSEHTAARVIRQMRRSQNNYRLPALSSPSFPSSSSFSISLI